MGKDGEECPACASMNTVYSEIREQTICRDCGMIFEPYESTASFSSATTDTVTLSVKEAPPRKRRNTKKETTGKKKTKKAAKKTTKKKATKKKATKKKTAKTKKKTAKKKSKSTKRRR